tara:strand:- start:299 stop:469 length:171 start_codon:yes stop_codon:yes gene_type:complete
MVKKGDILFILGLIVLFFGMLSIPIDSQQEPIRIIAATNVPYIDDNITYRGLEIFL